MTELKTTELLKAIDEIKKQISDKQNEKRNLESQKYKLECSIKNLQTEIESLKKEEITKRREYFNSLLEYANDKLDSLNPEANGIFSDELYVIFKDADYVYLFDREDSELTEIGVENNVARVYELRNYEDLLDDKKSDAYDNDNFLRRQRIDEIEHYYCNDSLSDYLYGITVSDVDIDDLLEDESNYMKGTDLSFLDSFIESDEQYFSQIEFYDLKEEKDEESK